MPIRSTTLTQLFETLGREIDDGKDVVHVNLNMTPQQRH